jgi:hypothetical protein
MRTTERTDVPGGRPPAEPPRRGGVSTGVAIGAALAVGLLGLLIGFLLFNDDDAEEDATEGTVPEEVVTALEGERDQLEAERDELQDQVDALDDQVDALGNELDQVTAERDQLQQQLDGTEQVETVPAPEVVGGTAEDAEDVADENGWTLVEREADGAPGDAEPGTVVGQSPSPGTSMIEGSVLVIDVVPEGDGG